jgi:hypothetical protein
MSRHLVLYGAIEASQQKFTNRISNEVVQVFEELNSLAADCQRTYEGTSDVTLEAGLEKFKSIVVDYSDDEIKITDGNLDKHVSQVHEIIVKFEGLKEELQKRLDSINSVIMGFQERLAQPERQPGTWCPAPLVLDLDPEHASLKALWEAECELVDKLNSDDDTTEELRNYALRLVHLARDIEYQYQYNRSDDHTLDYHIIDLLHTFASNAELILPIRTGNNQSRILSTSQSEPIIFSTPLSRDDQKGIFAEKPPSPDDTNYMQHVVQQVHKVVTAINPSVDSKETSVESEETSVELEETEKRKLPTIDTLAEQGRLNEFLEWESRVSTAESWRSAIGKWQSLEAQGTRMASLIETRLFAYCEVIDTNKSTRDVSTAPTIGLSR